MILTEDLNLIDVINGYNYRCQIESSHALSDGFFGNGLLNAHIELTGEANA